VGHERKSLNLTVMKKLVVLNACLMALLFISDQSTAQNYQIRDTCFYSDILGEEKCVRALLPPDYDEDTTISYPVVYYLHPAAGTYVNVSEWMDLINELTYSSAIHPMIVIGLDGQCPPYCGSFFTNSVLYGDYEDYIIQEAIPFTDSVFRTKASVHYRCIMGETMGGYGAMRLGLKHPDIFTGAASLSGFLQMDTLFSLWQPLLMTENTGPPYHFQYNGGGMFTNLTFGGAGAFSPNLNILPYQVEFPYDTNCNLVDSVVSKWKEHDCARLVKSLDTFAFQNPGIFFTCGTNDWAYFYPTNKCFEDTLIELGLPYKFLTTDAGHAPSDTMFTVGMQFLDSLMFDSIFVGVCKPQEADQLQFAAYPNPFKNVIYIDTEFDSNVSLYSLNGRLLYQGKITRSVYSIRLGFLPSGIYILVVNDGMSTATSKIIKY
jgi:hypothetical protein